MKVFGNTEYAIKDGNYIAVTVQEVSMTLAELQEHIQELQKFEKRLLEEKQEK